MDKDYKAHYKIISVDREKGIINLQVDVQVPTPLDFVTLELNLKSERELKEESLITDTKMGPLLYG